jgi:mRNA-degrading endonuclease RelE of RelBE toxin-antitoxin system
MEFFWTAEAEKELHALPSSVQIRIAEKMRWYASQSEPLHFAKPLTDARGKFRFRIGEYRVIVSPDGIVLVVVRVQKRADVYRKK